MSRAIALRSVAQNKRIHEAAKKQVAEQAEKARRQWEYDHFEPMVYGFPCPGTTATEYEKIISDARSARQNVMFGGHCPEQPILAESRAPSFFNGVLNFIGF